MPIKSSLNPSEVSFPLLGEKLDYLCAELGLKQKEIALKLEIDSSAISHWKGQNSISTSKISPLCKYLGIGRDDLKISNMEEFEKAIQKRFNNNTGNRWKVHAQRNSHRGWLGLEIIESGVNKSGGLKGVYQTPQNIQIPTRTKKVNLNDSVRFRLGETQAELLKGELKTILLIIENPTEIQLLTPEKLEPLQLKSNGYYFLPGNNAAPFYIGHPMGKHTAYFVSLTVMPSAELWQTFAEQPDGYAADALTKWMVENDIAHKINSIDFLVNA